MTSEELAALNTALLPFREVVREDTQEAVTVYWHSKMVRLALIEDPVAFGLTYGVVIAE